MSYFSIVTPVFNREDCLGRCIESVLRQKFTDWEMIIVDDGSQDGTWEIARQYSEKYPSIHAFHLAKNIGTAGARNRAVEYASGRYIFILDSDDYLLPDALGCAVTMMTKNPSYRQYLFAASDRVEYYRTTLGVPDNASRIFHYGEWVSGVLYGDFIHVLESALMKKNPFDEKVRIYENFWDFYKESQNQFFCNIVLTQRERFRPDSVSQEANMFHRAGYAKKIAVTRERIKKYGDDIIRFGGAPSIKRQIDHLYLNALLDGDADAIAEAKKWALHYHINCRRIFRLVDFLQLHVPFRIVIQVYSKLKNMVLYR